MRWQEPNKGAYLHPPAVDLIDGEECVVLDDHGELRAYGALGQRRFVANWTAAYSLSITGPLGSGGRWGVLRACGIHGLELRDGAGRRVWRSTAEPWHFAAGRPAIGYPGADRRPVLGAATRAREIQAIDTATGTVRWRLDVGHVTEAAGIAAGDIDGDGRDEFIVGLADGRLLCLAERDGQGTIRWSVRLGASVGHVTLADVDGDELLEILVATAEGAVSMLR